MGPVMTDGDMTKSAERRSKAVNDEPKRYREPGTGRFAYWNDFNRVCKCGHRLGDHVAGGFECGCDPQHSPETRGCKCQRFRPTGKRRRKRLVMDEHR